MLTRSLPRSVSSLLERFRGCFTAPTFEVFCALTVGFWAQPQAHTVTGMLVAAGLSATWHHSRAHRFFSKARWSADQLGLVLLELILAVLVPADAPVRLVVDDTLMRRAGRKIFGAAWHHDPLGVGRNAIAWGNNWVVLGVLVDLPFVPHRPVCLPILARLWRPGHTPGRLDLAVELVKVVCGHLGTRRIDLVCDGAYAGRQLRDLPAQATVCCRLRADAALHRLAPPRRPGTRGRPRTRGDRLPELCTLAGLVTTPFALHQVTRYGQGGLAAVAGFACLWPAVLGTRPVNVVLVRAPDAPDGFDLALVTTDLAATPAELVQRYAARWQVEVCFRQTRQDAGVGQARNRVRLAVERTVPFGLVCYSLAIVWYAQHGHSPAEVAAHRARAPWYQTKAAPSVADMLAKLRRVLIAAQYRPGQLSTPTIAEILEVQAAWAAAGA
jgi:DDE superfamily endonuclease